MGRRGRLLPGKNPEVGVSSRTAMECPHCGAMNAGSARFCRRCGRPLEGDEERELTLHLGAMAKRGRRVRSLQLRQGRIEPARGLIGRLRGVLLPDLVEEFLEAARHLDRAARVRLSGGGGSRSELLLEGASVRVEFRVHFPYARFVLRGPGGAVRQLLRRFLARGGEKFLAPHDGRDGLFRRRTGLDREEIRSRIIDLLG